MALFEEHISAADGSKSRDGRLCPRVLIVDDEAVLLRVLRIAFESKGFEVVSASTGRGAIDVAHESQPDVIVMDVHMPVMDGLEATRQLKNDQATSRIPIILLTGMSQTEDVIAGLDAGAEEYMSKPFAPNELLARVRTLTRLNRAYRKLDSMNTQLSDQVSDKTRQLEILYSYAQALNKTTDLEQVYKLVVGTVENVTGSRRISLMLKESDGQHLTCVAAVGIEQEVVARIRVESLHGVAGQVFTTGKSLAAKTHQDSHGGDLPVRYETDSFLCTPLISRTETGVEETIGVLNVTERGDGKSFEPHEIHCVNSVAHSAAIAISNLQQMQRLQDSVDVLLQTIGRLAEYRDEETTSHLDRVSRYARIVAEQLRGMPRHAESISAQFLQDLRLAAPLHDIGKVGIPDDILTKPGKLTDEEFEIMKTHTDIGRQTLEFAMVKTGSVPLLQMCVDIAYCHHERFNGKGYPRGLRGRQIPLCARIIALVDAYDAITSRRRYSAPRSHPKAIGIIKAERGEHFDPDVVDAFLQCQAEFDKIRSSHWSPEDEPELTPV